MQIRQAGCIFKTVKKRADFVRATASQDKIVTPAFVCQRITVAEPAATNTYHIGFTATKKIGKAVERNRCKRRLRALTTEIMANMRPSHQYAYIFIARFVLLTRDHKKLQNDLRYVLHQFRKQDTDSAD